MLDIRWENPTLPRSLRHCANGRRFPARRSSLVPVLSLQHGSTADHDATCTTNVLRAFRENFEERLSAEEENEHFDSTHEQRCPRLVHGETHSFVRHLHQFSILNSKTRAIPLFDRCLRQCGWQRGSTALRLDPLKPKRNHGRSTERSVALAAPRPGRASCD